MVSNRKFKLPALRLQGTMVLAAAVIFTVALGAGNFSVLNIAMQGAIKQGNLMLGSMADKEAIHVNQILAEYADAARSLASTGSALLADPTAGPELYTKVTLPQLETLDGSMAAYMLFFADANLKNRPGFATSPNMIFGDNFTAFASRDASGKVISAPQSLNGPDANLDWTKAPREAGGPSVVTIIDKGQVYTTFQDVIKDTAGKVVGISGVAFNATDLSGLINVEPPMGTGFMGVMTESGAWVVHQDPKMIGQVSKDDWTDKIRSQLATQDSYQYTDSVEGANWSVVARKFDVVGSTEPWTIIEAVPHSTLLADAFAQMMTMGGSAVVVLVVGLIGFWLLGRYIARPVARMTGVMRRIANSEFDLEVPYANRRDEIGEMAAALEVFRENGLKVAQLTDAEAARIVADQRARERMMSELQAAFGTVVDAATQGDFSRRVTVEFPDPELNTLAGSVNNLVETVDAGLSETSGVLAALAHADLTQRITGSYAGAFGQLKDDTNAVADKLSDIVGQLQNTSRGLKQATGEILEGTNDLAERTTKQAATIEETSATMEQLAQTVQQNAARARQASGAAGAVNDTAEVGGRVMSQANEAMVAIENSSAKISNIIGLIDDIAFQTNLLALNASVEAARAGDAGKGFAVVAVEVRRLAQSAASASADVKLLIEQSAKEVNGGSKLVAEAAQTLASILEAARSSSELMDGIAKESQEQANAIDQVNVAVRQLDEMTQHNAALVEETNAAIEQTEGQANELDAIVGLFRVSGHGEPTRSARAAAPAPSDARGLHKRLASAAKSYLTRGNAAVAVKQDWSEF